MHRDCEGDGDQAWTIIYDTWRPRKRGGSLAPQSREGSLLRASVAVTGLNFHPPPPSAFRSVNHLLLLLPPSAVWLSNRFNIAARRRISRFRDHSFRIVFSRSTASLLVCCVIVAFAAFQRCRWRGYSRESAGFSNWSKGFVRGAWNNWGVVLKFLKRAVEC